MTNHNAVLRSAKGVGPYLQFLRTPDVKTVWNRVHLDIRPYPGDDPEAEAARLQSLGATAIDLGRSDVVLPPHRLAAALDALDLQFG